MFAKFSDRAQKILTIAKDEMISLKHPYIGTEHLVLAVLKDGKNEVSKILGKEDITYRNFKKEVENKIGYGTEVVDLKLYTPLLKRVIENAIKESKNNGGDEVSDCELFISMLNEGEGVAIRLLMGMDKDIGHIYAELYRKTKPRNVDRRSVRGKRTKILEELGVNLTERARNNELDEAHGRDTELFRLMEILSRRNKNNPILIGEAGVGKTAIVEELSRKIISGDVPEPLKDKQIISLDMATSVAGTKYRGEFEERMQDVLEELKENDDIILFVDEIHTLVGAGGAEGAIDASNIFKPALARGDIRCIGATTTTEYHKHFEVDQALERRFQKIEVKEPDINMTRDILYKIKPIYENFHHVTIPDEIVDTIIQLSDEYITERFFPDKAIDLLDESCARLSLKNQIYPPELKELEDRLLEVKREKDSAIINQTFEKAEHFRTKEKDLLKDYDVMMKEYEDNQINSKPVLSKEVLASVIYDITKIPVNHILSDDNNKLKDVDIFLKERLIGQDEAVDILIKNIKRNKFGLKDNDRPSGVYLFVGSTGVGKTYAVKLLAEGLLGSKDKIIRLDMSEFMEKHSVSKIIGSPPGYVGYDDHNNFVFKVRKKPYSVILLDEIEKAHKDVLNIFLQIFDEGKIKDSKNREIDFTNTVIVMTSNLGSNDSTQNSVGFVENQENKKINDKLSAYFNKEFLNRIDGIISFNSLNKENIKNIVELEIKKTINKMDRIDITLEVTENVKDYIVTESNFDLYGAREIKRKIRDTIEDGVIDTILAKNIEKPCEVICDYKEEIIYDIEEIK